MKKALLTIITVFIISANAMAFNIYFDGFGGYVGMESAENQVGGGAGMFFGINKNFGVGFTFSYSSFIVTTLEERGKSISAMHSFYGLEYNFQIAGLPLFWRSFLGAGFESVNIHKPYTEPFWPYSQKNLDLGGMAFAIQIMTGIRWDFHPHIALFANVGFHAPFFTQEPLKDWTLYGLEANIGVRFAIWNNKPLDQEYR